MSERSATYGTLASLHLSAATVTDVVMALGPGVIVAQRVDMFVRGRRILERARLG